MRKKVYFIDAIHRCTCVMDLIQNCSLNILKSHLGRSTDYSLLRRPKDKFYREIFVREVYLRLLNLSM